MGHLVVLCIHAGLFLALPLSLPLSVFVHVCNKLSCPADLIWCCCRVGRPPCIPLTTMVMRDNTAYLLDNGRIMVLWLGRAIPQTFMQQVQCCLTASIIFNRTLSSRQHQNLHDPPNLLDTVEILEFGSAHEKGCWGTAMF